MFMAAFCAPVFAQTASVGESHNVVSLSASASVEVPQDLLTIVLRVVKEGAAPGAVQEQLRVALEAALAEAKKSARSGAMDVRTGAINLSPRYGRDGKISGWTGSAELVLEGRDFALIANTAGQSGSMAISNTYFGLSSTARAKAENEVQSTAIDRFKARATGIARDFGFEAYTVRNVAVSGDELGANVPRPRMMAMAAAPMVADAAPIPVEAGKSTVVVNVSGTVQLK